MPLNMQADGKFQPLDVAELAVFQSSCLAMQKLSCLSVNVFQTLEVTCPNMTLGAVLDLFENTGEHSI